MMKAKVQEKTKLVLCGIASLFFYDDSHAGFKEAMLIGSVSTLSSFIVTNQMATSVKIGMGTSVLSFFLKRLFPGAPAAESEVQNDQVQNDQNGLVNDLLTQHAQLTVRLRRTEQQQADRNLRYNQDQELLQSQITSLQRENEQLKGENANLKEQLNSQEESEEIVTPQNILSYLSAWRRSQMGTVQQARKSLEDLISWISFPNNKTIGVLISTNFPGIETSEV